MVLLPHKYLLSDLNSCPSLNKEERSTFTTNEENQVSFIKILII